MSDANGAPGDSLTGAVVDLLRRTAQVTTDAGRADLLARLEAAHTRISDPRRRVVVVGPLKQGKSQFVNTLLNATVCSVGDDETTAVPTTVLHSRQPGAQLIVNDGGQPKTVPIPFADVIGITPRTPHAQGREVVRLEVGIDSPILADGVVLTDTPGVGGHGNPHAASVLGLISSADCVLVLSDASTELTEPEVSFLRQAQGVCPAVALVVSKIDLYPHWRAIVAADQGHLERNGLELPVLAVSSLLRAHALRLQDTELNAESGFDALYEFLRDRLIARREQVTRAAVRLDLRAVVDHLALSAGSELAALRDPDSAEATVKELQQARTSAEELHKRTSLWQQSLGDGITDLASDIDHDLRDRLRRVTREAEEWVDANDPGQNWDALEQWLTNEVGAAVGDNFVWAHERAVWLAQVVAGHFAEVGTVALPKLELADLSGLFEPVESLSDLESGANGITQKVLIGMRGSYGGVVMFGMMSTFAGLALINPISLGAGVLLGAKAYKEDKAARLARRRADGKTAIRRFVEDVSFQTGKESKDRLRMVQRTLRDHFTAVAEQSLRSINDSLRAMQEAASASTAQRQERAVVLEQRVRALAEIGERIDTLLPPVQVAG